MKPGDLAKSICIEAAELLELFQWDNPTQEEVLKDAELMGKLRKELTDVFIYGLDMCVLLGIDTGEMIKDKLELVKKKYPAEIMRANHTAGAGSGKAEIYRKIRDEHRARGTN